MRKSLLAFLMVIGCALYADASSQKTKSADTGLPNLSARPTAQDKSIDIFGDALYWFASETVDWAFTTAGDQNFKTHYKTISFHWDPGFRVGLGYNMLHDQWDTQLAYTRFNTEAEARASGAVTSGFLAARLSLLEPFRTGKIRYDIHFNIFDWDLGRNFLVSKSLSFRPNIGIKGGWINQKMRLKWTIPNFAGLGFLYSASESVKNNFRGGGPKGGVNTKWIFGSINGHAFSLVGDFAAAFMWGRWTLRDDFTDLFLTHTSIPMKNHTFGAFMVQALIGLGWDFNFDKDRSRLALKLGYEIQDWLNQFQVFTNIAGTDNADLILQGLTVDLRFDF